MGTDGRYKRGNIWWGRVCHQGKEYRCSLRTGDEEASKAAYEKFRLEIEEYGSKVPTWKEALVNWFELIYMGQNDNDGLKLSARDRYRDSLRPISSLWENRKLSDCNTKALTEYMKLRKKGFTWYEVTEDGKRVAHHLKGCTNSTLHKDLTAVSSVFRAAIAAGLTSSNPAYTYDRRLVKAKRKYVLPPLPAEIATFLGYCNRNLRRAVEFSANTGMRKNEMSRLEWRDVRLAHGDVLLPTTKNSRPRAVKLQSPGGDALRTIERTPRHISAQWVFWNNRGERFSDFSNSFRNVMDRCVRDEGLAGREFRRFTLHSLRHAFAVRWLLAGGDIYDLSRHLGHTSVKTTEAHYLCMIADYRELVAARKAAQQMPADPKVTHIEAHASIGSVIDENEEDAPTTRSA